MSWCKKARFLILPKLVLSQIISVGAGSDTLYWNLAEEGLNPGTYLELDFPQVRFDYTSKNNLFLNTTLQ